MSKNIKSCPFCGSPNIARMEMEPSPYHECRECGSTSGIWNSRDPGLAKMVEDLWAAKEALEFYRNPSDYKSPLTGGLGKLYFDCGNVAKQAITLLKPYEKLFEKEGER